VKEVRLRRQSVIESKKAEDQEKREQKARKLLEDKEELVRM
jgi:hypothetical protein